MGPQQSPGTVTIKTHLLGPTWDCPTGAGLQICIPSGFPGDAGGGRAEVWDHTHLENQKQSGTLTNSRCGGGVGRSITFKTLCHY